MARARERENMRERERESRKSVLSVCLDDDDVNLSKSNSVPLMQPA